MSRDVNITVEELLEKLKEQGCFDAKRKIFLSEITNKSTFQNLHTKVENLTTKFLENVRWPPSVEKHQLREQLRLHIQSTDQFNNCIDRLVEQEVNCKIQSELIPLIESKACEYLDVDYERWKANIVTRAYERDVKHPRTIDNNNSIHEETQELSQIDAIQPTRSSFPQSVPQHNPNQSNIVNSSGITQSVSSLPNYVNTLVHTPQFIAPTFLAPNVIPPHIGLLPPPHSIPPSGLFQPLPPPPPSIFLHIDRFPPPPPPEEASLPPPPPPENGPNTPTDEYYPEFPEVQQVSKEKYKPGLLRTPDKSNEPLPEKKETNPKKVYWQGIPMVLTNISDESASDSERNDTSNRHQSSKTSAEHHKSSFNRKDSSSRIDNEDRPRRESSRHLEPSKNIESQRSSDAPSKISESQRNSELIRNLESTRISEPYRRSESSRNTDHSRHRDSSRNRGSSRKLEPSRKREPSRTSEPYRKSESSRKPESTRRPEPPKAPEQASPKTRRRSRTRRSEKARPRHSEYTDVSSDSLSETEVKESHGFVPVPEVTNTESAPKSSSSEASHRSSSSKGRTMDIVRQINIEKSKQLQKQKTPVEARSTSSSSSSESGSESSSMGSWRPVETLSAPRQVSDNCQPRMMGAEVCEEQKDPGQEPNDTAVQIRKNQIKARLQEIEAKTCELQKQKIASRKQGSRRSSSASSSSSSSSSSTSSSCSSPSSGRSESPSVKMTEVSVGTKRGQVIRKMVSSKTEKGEYLLEEGDVKEMYSGGSETEEGEVSSGRSTGSVLLGNGGAATEAVAGGDVSGCGGSGGGGGDVGEPEPGDSDKYSPTDLCEGFVSGNEAASGAFSVANEETIDSKTECQHTSDQ